MAVLLNYCTSPIHHLPMPVHSPCYECGGIKEAQCLGAGQPEEEGPGHEGQLLPRPSRTQPQGDCVLVVPGFGGQQTPGAAGQEGLKGGRMYSGLF